MESRLDFGKLLTDAGLIGEGVEVGVLFGEYSECILSTWNGILHLVDPWIQQPSKIYKDGCNAVDLDDAYSRASSRVARFGSNAVIWRMFSVDASKHFKDGSLCFVYLDGNHSEKSVSQDIEVWWPKIKSGGIFCGHDFYDNHSDYQECGVKSAVEKFALDKNLAITTTPCTSWWIKKP